jgi:hypothetical protein
MHWPGECSSTKLTPRGCCLCFEVAPRTEFHLLAVIIMLITANIECC